MSGLAQLAALVREGQLDALDVGVAETLAELSGSAAPAFGRTGGVGAAAPRPRAGALAPEAEASVVLAAALAHRAARRGHVCLELTRVAGAPLRDEDGVALGEPLPTLEVWRAALERSPLVGTGVPLTPLVLAGTRLYLHRLFDHEQHLALALQRRAGAEAPALDEALLAGGLGRLFPAAPATGPDWQRIAACLAVSSRLTVITGGPGTGKTSLVVKVLALLAEQALARRGRLRALLLAPTGKAAARLGEAIAGARQALGLAPEVAALVPEATATVHRALGRGAGPGGFRHGPEFPLVADCVVVDECSMVDLTLMRRLVDAVPQHARLLLLGDPHQLTSVEAGAVLADVAGPDEVARSASVVARVAALTGDSLVAASGRVAPLADHCVRLRHSHRFDGASPLGALARAIHDGDPTAVAALLRAGGGGALEWHAAEPAAVAARAAAAHAAVLGAPDAASALAAFEASRVLAAHRRGRWGVEALNRLIEEELIRRGLLASARGAYPGRPLLVTRNDPAARLANGDVGLLWQLPEGLRAVFGGGPGAVRACSPARLGEHETTYAMTIHKSQGSEWDDVAVVLPEARSPLLSRELLYTAVTRARRRVAVYASDEALRAAVERRVDRASGLGERLWPAAEFRLELTDAAPPRRSRGRPAAPRTRRGGA